MQANGDHVGQPRRLSGGPVVSGRRRSTHWRQWL